MKTRSFIVAIAVAVVTAMIIPTGVAAQNDPAQSKKGQHHHYQFIDLGTFGGPTSVNPGPLFAAGTKCHEMPILRV